MADFKKLELWLSSSESLLTGIRGKGKGGKGGGKRKGGKRREEGNFGVTLRITGCPCRPVSKKEAPFVGAMANLDTANTNSHVLLRYLNMPNAEWALVSAKDKKREWWSFLKIAQPAAAQLNTDVASKLDTLRNVFASPYICRTGVLWIKHLLDGKVQCTICCGANFKSGLMLCSVSKVGRHLGNDMHKDNEKKLVARKAMGGKQIQRIDEMAGGVLHGAVLAAGGGAAHAAAALVVGCFAAGTHGAAGVPPSSIPKLLNKHMLGIIQNLLLNGIPAPSTITSTTLPFAVALVEERLKSVLKGQPISLYIDGGSSNLADGRKVVCVCASSLEDSVGSVLLDVLIMEAHETGDSQTAQIEALVAKYDILRTDVHYLCADNASPNKATVDKLNTKGYNITYARCLPHCLNLIVRAFMNVMDKEYKFASNLKLMRHFLTAGGGVGRKLVALEFGFTVSGVDFCDTRWASLVYAILYVANKQSASHLLLAKERLQELADQGDDTAKDALDNPGQPRVIFNVLHDFVESILEKDLSKRFESDDVNGAEASLTDAKKKLLHYFSKPLHFLAFQLIDIILGGDVGDKTEKLSTLFTITQGNPAYRARLNSSTTGEVPTAVQATRNLLARLKGLHYHWTGADAAMDVGSALEQTEKRNIKGRLQRVFDELQKRAVLQAEAVVENCKIENHDIMDAKKPFDQADADEWVNDQLGLFKDRLLPKLQSALAAAVLAVDEAAGLVKTEECVSGLEASQVFDMNIKPKDFADDQDLLRHLSFTRPYPFTETVVEEWRTYASAWHAPPVRMSPTEVYEGWKALHTDMPTLAQHAMRQFSRPISSAACERVFSYMEHMDKPDRRRMKKDTLRTLLFLRGNQGVLENLLEEANLGRIDSEVERTKAAKAAKKAKVGDGGGP